jgi:hypothetical protein
MIYQVKDLTLCIKCILVTLTLLIFACNKEVIEPTPQAIVEPVPIDTTFTIVGEWVTADSTESMTFGNQFVYRVDFISRTFDYNWTPGYPHSKLTYYDGFNRTLKFKVNAYNQIVRIEAFETVFNKK